MQLSTSQDKLAGKRIEIVAKDSKITSLTNTFTNTDVGKDEGLEKFRDMSFELANMQEQLDAEKQRVKEAEAKAIKAQQDAQETISKLESRKKDLKLFKTNERGRQLQYHGLEHAADQRKIENRGIGSKACQTNPPYRSTSE